MARLAKRLSARTVATAGPGKHADGDGLYLVVTADASGERRRWIYNFTLKGRRREMGLGSAREVSLAQARNLADEARKLVRGGQDPISARDQTPPETPSFGAFADQLVEEIERGFKNAKHRYQWRLALTTYAEPIRAKLIDEIRTDDVLECLKPIWLSKSETAYRVRGRIERVLDAAKARGLRSGENPARWRGHLDALLPRKQRLKRGHHPALPFDDVPHFVAQLRKRQAVAALALEFLILTASRPGEVFGATWSEIDLDGALWSVPASRMKTNKAHRVPLSARAVEILQELSKLHGGTPEADACVFPGARRGRPLSNMAFAALLRRMGQDSISAHGFRSSFRDWCGEATAFPREVAEAALSHTVGNAVEQAYRRGDALEKRRKLMDAWASYCSEPRPSNVLEMKKKR